MNHVFSVLNLFLFALVSLFSKNVYSQTILIGSGMPLGRFGDVATNVLMAEHLQSIIPNFKIVIYVTPESIETISSLVPEVKRFPVDQINFLKNGILYISPEEIVLHESQRPIFHFSFSNVTGFPTKNYFKARQKVPPSLSFSEYQGKYLSGKENKHVTTTGKIHMPTTGPRFAGLYISPHGKNHLSPDNDFSSLDEQELFSIQEAIKSKYVVFLYSRDYDLMKSYVRKIVDKIHGDTITVFAPPFLLKLLESDEYQILTDKIRFVSNSGSFEMTKAMMKISNLPLLVTGDVSLSLAHEYKKPFIYAVVPWKEDFARDLRILFPTALFLDENRDHMNDFENFHFEDYANSFYSHFDKYRSSLSLPDKIKNIIGLSQKIILKRMEDGHSPFIPTNDLNSLFNIQNGRDKCWRILSADL